MGNLAHGSPHGLQPHRIAEQLVHRLVDREVLGNERRHAVVDQKINIALLVTGIGSNSSIGRFFARASDTVRPPGLDTMQSDALIITSTLCTKP